MNLQSSPAAKSRNRTVAEWLWPFVPMGIAALSLSAVSYYHLHRHEFVPQSALQRFFAGVHGFLGFAPSVMFFGMVIVWSTLWCVTGRIDRPLGRLLRLVAMAVMLGMLLNLGGGGTATVDHQGALGAWCAGVLVDGFGYVVSLLLVGVMTLASVLLATDFFFQDAFERLRSSARPAVPAADGGVEPAVAEHLRRLAEEVPAEPAVPVAAAPVSASPSEPVVDAFVPPVTNEVEEPRRRRSYFERRYEREAEARERAPREDEWVPAAPDNQEIDNPESAEPALPEAAASPGGELDGADQPPIAARAVWHAEPEPEPEPEPAIRSEPEPDALVAATTDEGTTHEGTTDEVAADEGFDAALGGPAEEPPLVEPLVEIPRPDPLPEPIPEPDLAPEPVAMAAGDVPQAEAPMQQQLFGAAVDEALLAEATEVVTLWRRASVAFLQRKLRIDYATATEVLAALAARGVVAIEGDATQGRVLG